MGSLQEYLLGFPLARLMIFRDGFSTVTRDFYETSALPESFLAFLLEIFIFPSGIFLVFPTDITQKNLRCPSFPEYYFPKFLARFHPIICKFLTRIFAGYPEGIQRKTPRESPTIFLGATIREFPKGAPRAPGIVSSRDFDKNSGNNSEKTLE